MEGILKLVSLLLLWSEFPGYLNTEPIANDMPDPSKQRVRRIFVSKLHTRVIHTMAHREETTHSG